MKKKPEITEEIKRELEIQLSEQNITKTDVSREAKVSLRAVMYFFSTQSQSMGIYMACLRLIQRKIQANMEPILQSHKNFSKLIK